jgi:hypothetical protein
MLSLISRVDGNFCNKWATCICVRNSNAAQVRFPDIVTNFTVRPVLNFLLAPW